MPYLFKGGIIGTWTPANNPRAFAADVLVENDTIVKIEQKIDVGPDVQVVDCTGKWIIPGLIDTHRHIWMTVMRGSHGDWLLTEYIVKNSWHEQGDVTVPEIRIGQLAGCLDALNSGVTTILDHFHAANSPEHADAVLDATIQSGARVILSLARQSAPTQVFPTFEFGKEADAAKWQWAKLEEWAKKGGGKLTPDGRVLLGVAYDLDLFNPDPALVPVHQENLKRARALPAAVITSHVVSGPRILDWEKNGLLGPDVVFSHCNELWRHPQLDDDMWKAMKKHNVAIASTPADELNMAHGNPVAFEAVDRGVKCGLGIDCTSANGGDIFTQMRVAIGWARGRRNEEVVEKNLQPPQYFKHNAADAFRLATLGGAEALNLADSIGTIEVGKKADIVVLDANSVNLAGIRDPFKGVVFHATDADVELVMVNGEIVKKDGKLCKVEWAPVARELREKAEAIRERWPDAKLDEYWTKFYEQNPYFKL